jgi:RimJ/RimL family protein N-acetyltransferase
VADGAGQARAPEVIRTSRLLASRISLEHEPLFMGLHQDQRVVRWLGAADEEVTARDNRAWLDERMAHWDRHRFGMYTLFETAAADAAADAPEGGVIAATAGRGSAVGEAAGGRFAGRAGLQRVAANVGETVGDPGGVELMYALAHRAWGRGLATEIAGRLLEVARDDLGLAEVIADTVPDNARSRAVIERLGMAFQGSFWHDDHWMVWYRMAL